MGFSAFAKEIEFLQAESVDLQTTGFEIPEIEMIFAAGDKPPASIEEDTPPEIAPASVVAKANDLWILGEHRLFCGDARHLESFAALMDGSRAQLVFVDPPYNVQIRGHVSGKGRIKHREFTQASGEKTSAQFTKFLEDTSGSFGRTLG